MFNPRAKEYLSYHERRSGRTAFWRIVRFFLYLFLGYLVLTHFFITARAVSSGSMEPELSPGDLVLATPLLYGPTIPLTSAHLPGFGKLQRGDVVVATPPYYRAAPFYLRAVDSVVRFFTLQRVSIIHADPDWDHRLIMKRLLGLPGDTVRMRNYTVYVRKKGTTTFVPEYQVTSSRYQVSRNGLPDKWSDNQPFSSSMPDITLGPDQYFLIGDNRISSVDSRYFGPVSRRAILEKVILRYYPFPRFGAMQ